MLEQLVRPFQSPQTRPNTRIRVGTVPKLADDVVFQVTSSAEAEIISEGVSFTTELPKDQYKETNRTERTVRIENPDDPSQYVMVKRPESMRLAKSSNAKKKEETVKTVSQPKKDPGVAGEWKPEGEAEGTAGTRGEATINWKQGDPLKYPGDFVDPEPYGPPIPAEPMV